MKREYIKYDRAIEMLKDGWIIYTERGEGRPYSPLFFHLWGGENEKINGGEVHHQTLHKLIKNKIIHGANRKHGKYTLINTAKN